MLFEIAKIIMVLIVIVNLFCLVFPIHLTKRQLIFLWMSYVLVLAFMGFFIEPSIELDLYRMYREIDKFRNGGRAVLDSPMFILNGIYWLISCTDNNGWLVFSSVLIWGGCIKGILKKYLNENIYVTRAVILYFLSVNAGCFIVYLLSGIRSSLAVAIWCYAYFKWYEDKRCMYYLIAGTTIFIHTFGVILLGFTFLFHFLQKKKSISTYVITFLIILLCGYVMNASSKITVSTSFRMTYLDLLADKFRVYSVRGHEFQQTRELMFRIINAIYFLSCLVYLHIKKITKYEIVGFFILVMFAGFNMSILFERMPYALGLCTLPIINESILISKKMGRLVIISTGILILGAQVLWGIYETSIWIDFVV